MGREVAVLGIGCTKVGELWDNSLRDLMVEASLKALDDAKLQKVDAIYVGNMAAEALLGQGNTATLLADSLALGGTPAVRVEGAIASGALALHEGVKAVASGLADHVLVTGVEKFSDTMENDAVSALIMAEDQEYTAYSGVSLIGLFAMMARLYSETYGANPEDMAAFPVNAHKNASHNPHAQFRYPISVQDVLKSPFIADPLRLLEYSGVSDGAASVVLAPLEEVRRLNDTPIKIEASSIATEILSIAERKDLLTLNATQIAMGSALKEAGVDRGDIDLIEVDDTSSILGVVCLEDLGFVETGKGARFAAEGQIAINGKLPTNTMGGMKGRGNPPGAAGVYQAVELALQLRGEAGENQVEGAEVGLALNIGGVGSLAVVHIFGRV